MAESLPDAEEGASSLRKSLSRKSTFTSRIRVQAEDPTEPGADQRDGIHGLDRHSSTSTDDLQGFRSLDPDKVVLLRIECTTATELKLILTGMYTLLVLGTLALIALIVWKNVQCDDEAWLRNRIYFKMNVALASVCVAALSTTLAWGLWNTFAAIRSRKKWGKRRKRLLANALIQTTLQLINVAFWLTPHVHMLTHECGWFDNIVAASGIIQWTMWNSIFFIMTVDAHNSNPWMKHGQPMTFRADPLILDAPLSRHLPLVPVWLVFQGSLVFEVIRSRSDQYPQMNCKDISAYASSQPCRNPLHIKVVSILLGVFCTAYFCIYIFFNVRASLRLNRLPYMRFRTGNLLQNWQKRKGRLIMNFMLSSVLTSWYFSWDRCSSYFTTWLGLFPAEIVVTAAMVANALIMFPMRTAPPGQLPEVQAILQGFCWSEATFHEDMAQRNRHLSGRVKDVEKQPMFCLETAVKLLTFSWAVYGEQASCCRKQVDSLSAASCALHAKEHALVMDNMQQLQSRSVAPSILSISDLKTRTSTGMNSLEFESSSSASSKGPKKCLFRQSCRDVESGHASVADRELPMEELFQVAMTMYSLDRAHVIHDPMTDTKVLIAWSEDTMVIAFRGTASMKNVLHDLRAWRAVHLPKRGMWWFGGRPKVHRGFWDAWSAHAVRDRVVEYVRGILRASKLPVADWTVHLTGHSLGGALATLAAYDIQSAFGFKHLQVYTYGAPRTGNHAFARDYEALVPHTWHMVNDADMVPCYGKFLGLYKRPGQRVITDRRGSLVVRPSPLELHLRPTCRSVKAHFLKSYRNAMSAIARAQFTNNKGISGGRSGALALADNPHVFSYLCSTGLDLVALSEQGSDCTDECIDSMERSVSSEESTGRSVLPQWVHLTMDQVIGSSLDSSTVLPASLGPRSGLPDQDLISGSSRAGSHHHQSVR